MVILIAWFVLGWTASHAFPSSLVTDLVTYLFAGFNVDNWQSAPGQALDRAITDSLNATWKEIGSKVNSLATASSVLATDDKEEARKLNYLDSEYWLVMSAMRLLSAGTTSSDRESITWTLNELDEDRQVIASRLAPHKAKHYKWLSRFESAWDMVYAVITLKGARRARDLERLERILTDLRRSYTMQDATPDQIQEMLESLNESVMQHSQSRALHKIAFLLNWVYSPIADIAQQHPEDPQYKDRPVRARQTHTCYHLPHGCSNYPKIETLGDQEKFRLFRTEQEAQDAGLTMCGNCKRIIASKLSGGYLGNDS